MSKPTNRAKRWTYCKACDGVIKGYYGDICDPCKIKALTAQRDELLKVCKEARSAIIGVLNLRACLDYPSVKLPHNSEQGLARLAKRIREAIAKTEES